MAERKKVAVIMGSGSDAATMQAAIGQLEALNIAYEAHVMSAHRSPQKGSRLCLRCQSRVLASLLRRRAKRPILPVCWLPIPLAGGGCAHPLARSWRHGRIAVHRSNASSVPVATVAIDGAKNATLLAAQILAVTDADLAKRLSELKLRMEADVLAQDRALFDSSN